MERRIRVRIISLVVLIGLVFSLFSFRIYKLQTAMTEEEMELQDSLTYQTTVSAARGQILDRNGTVLVTNRASYDLVIINFVLFNGPNPNESLLNLLHTMDELGIELLHHLPVTETRPYEYTLDDMGEIWHNYFRKFLTKRSLDSDISAPTFMDNLREQYNLPEGLSDYDAYRLIAIRFELDLRNIDGMPLDNYILAEDVEASQLASIIELDIPGVIGIKMSDYNIFLMRSVMLEYPDKVVYTGLDEMLIPGLFYGADGSIGTWGNLLPNMYSKAFAKVRAGDVDSLKPLMEEFTAFLAIGWNYGIIDTFEELMLAKGYANRCFRHPSSWNPGKVPQDVLDDLIARMDKINAIAAAL